tara:strand:- start:51 stop:209 length:159 start_codon:yes stop_codon:yes gene_type:complete
VVVVLAGLETMLQQQVQVQQTLVVVAAAVVIMEEEHRVQDFKEKLVVLVEAE